MLDMQLCVTTNKENMVFTKNKEKIVVNKNIDINIDSYPISMAILIVPNIVDIDIEIDISLTPGCGIATGPPGGEEVCSISMSRRDSRLLVLIFLLGSMFLVSDTGTCCIVLPVCLRGTGVCFV